MTRIIRCLRSLALPVGLAIFVSSAATQVPGVSREQMWPAPTAEDWKLPVLITFQRTWEDALAVSKETGKPILICVNMDGEIASEHYAGIRYRQPEKAKLYEPYVCVIASVYRHTPRDYDEQGRPILCPRFGSVTCGEHIAIEPILYEKFFDGQRIAPRHIMVELNGEEAYDVFYAFDTDSVFKAIEDGIANRSVTPDPVVRGDRTIVERVASRDIVDRDAVEKAYEEGDRDLRRRLLEAAIEHGELEPNGLLRLAVFGFDTELSKLAREALARTNSAGAVDLIAQSLRVPMDEDEREALIAALARLGESSPRARTLAVVHQGLGTKSTEVDVEGWSTALKGGAAYAPATDWTVLETRLDDQAKATRDKPDDATTRLELAEASLAMAVDPKTKEILAADPRTARTYARLMFEDAHRAALQAEKLGATGWRVDAAIALSAFYLGDVEMAYARAEAAVKSMHAGAEQWSAIATLALFARSRQEAIMRAVREKTDWPGQWLTDVNAAYSVLARHPLGTDEHVAAHYEFLNMLGAVRRATRVLDEGLTRFPDSWALHDCLRGRILADKGVAGLESAYAAMIEQENSSPSLHWYAGYAAIVEAEFHRRAGNPAPALAAYDRAIAHYERSILEKPDTKPTADHYVAISISGQARMALEGGDVERALELLLASLERKPEAAASLDGLNISPADTARMLRAQLTTLERKDLLAKLEDALAKLDPRLLELPAYERGGQRPGGRGARNPGGRGRRGRRGR